jgi:hypothetical protein
MVLHHKHTLDSNTYKYKALSCCQGDLEKGNFDTIAPIVAWCTVCLFLRLLGG